MRWVIALVILSVSLFSSNKCSGYIQQVRTAHYSQFGVDYPYQYGMGQLIQESGCRNILSLDGVGSEGLPQITYRVWKKPLSEKGVADVKTVANQLRAQAIIMKNCHDSNPTKKLWVTYQLYNGGGLVLKEVKRSGTVRWLEAKQSCKRGQSCFTYKGKTTCRSNCDINYEYSQNVFKYGGKYASNTQSRHFAYW